VKANQKVLKSHQHMINTQTNFHIIGSGAVGSLLALILSNNHQNVLFTDTRNSWVSDKTVWLTGNLAEHFGDSKSFEFAKPPITQDNCFLLLCTKYSADLIQNMNPILKAYAEKTPVLLLQNAYRHARSLRMSFDNPFFVGMLSGLEVFYKDNSLELASSPFTLTVADSKQNTIEKFQSVANSPISKFLHADNEELVVWKKLARWIPLSCITTITMTSVGNALQLFPRTLLNNLIIEICRFAESETETTFDHNQILDQLNLLPKKLFTSSMRDRQRNRLPEIKIVMSEIYQDSIAKNLPSSAILATLKLLP